MSMVMNKANSRLPGRSSFQEAQIGVMEVLSRNLEGYGPLDNAHRAQIDLAASNLLSTILLRRSNSLRFGPPLPRAEAKYDGMTTDEQAAFQALSFAVERSELFEKKEIELPAIDQPRNPLKPEADVITAHIASDLAQLAAITLPGKIRVR